MFTFLNMLFNKEVNKLPKQRHKRHKLKHDSICRITCCIGLYDLVNILNKKFKVTIIKDRGFSHIYIDIKEGTTAHIVKCDWNNYSYNIHIDFDYTERKVFETEFDKKGYLKHRKREKEKEIRREALISFKEQLITLLENEGYVYEKIGRAHYLTRPISIN